MITSEYYGSANKIGTHQLAKQFANLGISVFIISFPISPLYSLIPDKTEYLARNKLSKAFVEIEQNIFCHVPKVLLPPLPKVLEFWPGYLDIWLKLCPKSQKLILNQKYDFVLTESLFFNAIYRKIKKQSLILRLPDNLSGFWGDITVLKKAEADILAMCDLVVSPSHQILEELPESINNSMFLPNGVNLEQYTTQATRPKYYENLQQKHHAIYVGAIQKWFDHELLKAVARRKPDWSFTIVGKVDSSVVADYPDNVYFVGEIPNTQIHKYLQHADAGIIPFEVQQNSALIKYVNPIKMYEYLAAGLPVISTRWDEMERINAPVNLVESADEFAGCLEIVEKKPDAPETTAHFLSQFDWSFIARSLTNKIQQIDITDSKTKPRSN